MPLTGRENADSGGAFGASESASTWFHDVITTATAIIRIANAAAMPVKTIIGWVLFD